MKEKIKKKKNEQSCAQNDMRNKRIVVRMKCVFHAAAQTTTQMLYTDTHALTLTHTYLKI